MKNLQESRIEGHNRLVAMTLAAVTAAVVATAMIVVGQADASPPGYGHLAFHGFEHGKVKAKLKDGVLTIKGTSFDDRLALRLRAGDAATLELDVGDDGSADLSFRRADVASIVVKARRGDDRVRIDEANGVFTDAIPTTLSGGRGDDTLAGGSGAELMLGGYGDDSMDGNRGNDRALMGAGNDTFIWDPGDGSDTIEGEYGDDTMLFNGAGIVDTVDVSANANRLRFLRQPANITMDTAGVERVDFKALGGADIMTVNDLSGTDVREVRLDLGATDGQPDRVVVNGTAGNDAIDVSGDSAAVKVSGLAATVQLLNPEAANDRLDVNSSPGADTIVTGGLARGAIQLFVNGVLVP